VIVHVIHVTSHIDEAPNPPIGPTWLTVREASLLLNVSESWVRRHKSELPVVRIGGLIRFDDALLKRELACRIPAEKPLKLRGETMSQVRRWQRGSVYKTGKRIKTWYGVWREDVLDAEGKMKRRQRNVMLGTVAELPTQTAARGALTRYIGASLKPKVEVTLSEVFQRWQRVASLSLKATT
jgi:excisionase family DNA binding protein